MSVESLFTFPSNAWLRPTSGGNARSLMEAALAEVSSAWTKSDVAYDLSDDAYYADVTGADFADVEVPRTPREEALHLTMQDDRDANLTSYSSYWASGSMFPPAAQPADGARVDWFPQLIARDTVAASPVHAATNPGLPEWHGVPDGAPWALSDALLAPAPATGAQDTPAPQRQRRQLQLHPEPYEVPSLHDHAKPEANNSVRRPSQAAAAEARRTGASGERVFKCTYQDCTKTYRKPSHLRAHLRVHTGERPFKCHEPGCTERFSRSDELTRHRRKHSGIRPFICHSCGKQFNRSDHLTSHQARHKSKQPGLIACLHMGCSAAFVTAEHLRAHMAMSHTE